MSMIGQNKTSSNSTQTTLKMATGLTETLDLFL